MDEVELHFVRLKPFDRAPSYDRDMRTHLWVVTATWRVAPPTRRPQLDQENMIRLSNIRCTYCGQRYRPSLQNTQCRGTPFFDMEER